MTDDKEQREPVQDMNGDLGDLNPSSQENKDYTNVPGSDLSGEASEMTVHQEDATQDEMGLLKAENLSLTEAVNQQKDLHLRTMADMDNLRKRMNREREEYVKYASLPLIIKFLAVMDDLERAFRLSGENQDYAALQKGLDMIYKRMTEIIKDEKVEEIPALNQPFDPKFHQALSVEPHEEHAENIIFEELQKGYTLHGRVIRPSLVKVSG